MTSLKPAERAFAGYAAQHELDAIFEPDWVAELGQAFTGTPDFLAAGNGCRAIVEVREFTCQPMTRHFGSRGGGVFDPAILTRPVYWAMTEKAKKLEEFARTGLPLIIALGNPRAPEVDLGDFQIKTAMFGTQSIHLPIDIQGGCAAGPARTVAEPGFGVFRRTDPDGEPLNVWPHISGVAVLSEFDRYSEFKWAHLDRYLRERAPVDQGEKMTLIGEWLETPVARDEAPGPTGSAFAVTYYDLSRYALGSGPAVPADWFTGPRDRRYVFDDDGVEFGPRTARPTPGRRLVTEMSAQLDHHGDGKPGA